MSDVSGKVIIVTGAGRGIGRGMAIALAKSGASVVIAEINLDNANAVAAEIGELGLQALAIACDVGVASDVDAMVDAVVSKFGRIDVLINNAQALFTESVPIEDFPEDRWDKTFQTGVKATWYCSKAVLPHMKNRGGKIINFGSGWGIYGAPGWCDYAGNKEAIRGFSKTAAKEWAKYDIQVNVITPAIATPLQAEVAIRYPDMPESKNLPGVHLGDAEADAGAAAIWLSSSASGKITGHTFAVGPGGIQTIHFP